MAFDPLTWAIGFALTSAARRLGAAIFGRSLNSELNKAFEAWADALGDDRGLDLSTFFPKIVDDAELVDRPALKQLRERLQSRRVPTLVEWHQALIEQWQRIRLIQGPDCAPFFKLPEFEASAALRDLATAIVGICERDDALFRGTVLGQLDELLSRSSGREGLALPDPFQWRDTSTLRDVAHAIESEIGARVEVIVLDDDEETVHLWAPLPGSTPTELKWSLLTVGCVASGIRSARLLEVGIADDTTSLPGSDGRGPVGMMKLLLVVNELHSIATTKVIPPNFWHGIRSFVLTNDNTPAQGWQETPFRGFEDVE